MKNRWVETRWNKTHLRSTLILRSLNRTYTFLSTFKNEMPWSSSATKRRHSESHTRRTVGMQLFMMTNKMKERPTTWSHSCERRKLMRPTTKWTPRTYGCRIWRTSGSTRRISILTWNTTRMSGKSTVISFQWCKRSLWKDGSLTWRKCILGISSRQWRKRGFCSLVVTLRLQTPWVTNTLVGLQLKGQILQEQPSQARSLLLNWLTLPTTPRFRSKPTLKIISWPCKSCKTQNPGWQITSSLTQGSTENKQLISEESPHWATKMRWILLKVWPWDSLPR